MAWKRGPRRSRALLELSGSWREGTYWRRESPSAPDHRGDPSSRPTGDRPTRRGPSRNRAAVRSCSGPKCSLDRTTVSQPGAVCKGANDHGQHINDQRLCRQPRRCAEDGQACNPGGHHHAQCRWLIDPQQADRSWGLIRRASRLAERQDDEAGVRSARSKIVVALARLRLDQGTLRDAARSLPGSRRGQRAGSTGSGCGAGCSQGSISQLRHDLRPGAVA
jgi:hypothetical protein